MWNGSKLARRVRKARYAPMIGWTNWRYGNAILKTRPVATRPSDAASPVELHVLTYHRDWEVALWGVKSFYHHSGVDWPLVFHIGGPDKPGMMKGLAHHFPNARIWTMAEADRHVEASLAERGLLRLIEGRRRSLPIRKITDFILTCDAPRVAAMDPDVLFFGPPDDFVAAGLSAADCRFMLDSVSAYCLTEEEIQASYGVRVLPRMNSGLYVVPLDAFSLERCDELLADERFYRFWMAEQTLQAVVACESGARHLPSTYRVSDGRTLHASDGRPLIAKHYTNTPRPDLYREGIRHLATRTDLLKALATVSAR